MLGFTGLTAYFGLLDVGQPQAGETVVVSAAAGATGSVVGQIARIKGCRAVGIAGGPEKCRWLTDELGFDAAVDYKADGWTRRLREACPNGIDVNFENVGGTMMDEVMSLMNLNGRVALCGMISGYNSDETMRGRFDVILMKRLQVRGFIVLDYLPRFAEGVAQLAQWYAEGRVKHRDTIVTGLEQAPTALNMLFDGRNLGKLLIKVADQLETPMATEGHRWTPSPALAPSDHKMLLFLGAGRRKICVRRGGEGWGSVSICVCRFALL